MRRQLAILFYLLLSWAGLAACDESGTGKAAGPNGSERAQEDGERGSGSQVSSKESVPKGEVSRKLEQFTGGHTRVVWMQHMHPEAKDTYAQGKSFYLAGIDTRDGKGIREIINKKGNYSRPMVTPDGRQIVYTSKMVTKKGAKKIKHYEAAIYVVGWDGKGAKKLREGYAADVWRDPATGVDWIYAGDRIEASGRIDLVSKKLIRFPLEDPSKVETVWDETEVGLDNIQLSRDGTHAGCLFPWPEAGILNIEEKTWKKHSDGCWTSLAPDNSYVSWVFDGAHRNVTLYGDWGEKSWKINLSKGASKEGYEVYHPRWSNHVRFLAMSGPYRQGEGRTEKDVGRLGKGGKGVEIVLGKFAPDHKQMEGFFQLTDNSYGNFFPDLWVSGGDEADMDLVAAGITGSGETTDPGSATAKKWPTDSKGLLFKWENIKSENRIKLPDGGARVCRLTPRNAARVYQNYEMELAKGYFEAEKEVAAQVARDLASASDWSLELAFSLGRKDEFSATFIVSKGATTGAVEQVFLQLYPKEMSVAWGDKAYAVRFAETITAFDLHHLAVIFNASSKPAIYLDGQKQEQFKVTTFDSEVDEELQEAYPQPIVLSSAVGVSVRADQFAIYNRALGSPEIESHAALNRERSKKREYREHIRVKAKLVEVTPALPVARIQPYAAALAVHTWEVIEQTGGALDSGELKVGEQINVAHWTYLDRTMIEDYPRKVGEERTLFLESFEKHPYLGTQRRNDGDVDVLLPFFYDVSTPLFP